jgi:hypothetical protein
MSHTNAGNRYHCNVFNYGRAGDVQHARIGDKTANAFFDGIFEHAAEWALSHLSSGADNGESRRTADARRDLLDLTREIPLLEAREREKIEARLDPEEAEEAGTREYEQMIAARVAMRMRSHYARRDELQQSLALLSAREAQSGPLARRADAEGVVSAWSTLDTATKNAFLRTYFSTIYCETDEDGTEWLRPVLRDREREWPRIPVTMEKTRYGLSRRLPEPADYALGALRKHVGGIRTAKALAGAQVKAALTLEGA